MRAAVEQNQLAFPSRAQAALTVSRGAALFLTQREFLHGGDIFTLLSRGDRIMELRHKL